MKEFSLHFTFRGEGEFRLEADSHWSSTVTSLSGSSGAGKTTLFRSLLGLLPQRTLKGSIRLDQQTVYDSENKINLTLPQRNLSWVPQDILLFPHMTVEQNISFAPGGSQDSFNDLVEGLELTPFLGSMPKDLSGGQAQRVSIARALMSQFNVVLMDEPMAHLDKSLREKTMTVIFNHLKSSGRSAIISSHHPEDLMAVADTHIRVTDNHHLVMDQTGR